MALFSVCSVCEACRLVSLLYSFIYLFIVLRGVAWRGVAWRGVACSVYGASGWALAAFTVFLLFMECWGWTFVAFTAFLASIRRSGWSFWWRLEC